MSDKTDESRWMKTGEAARVLGICQATVRAAVKRGDLSAIRIGTHILIAREPLRLVGRTEHTAPVAEAGTRDGGE